MWLTPSLLLIALRITSRIFLVLSSPSLFISWVGLELNTLAFLPILLSRKNKLTSESSIKYFLTQTLASVIVIIGGLTLLILQAELRITVILFGLAIKLGAAPFHGWVVTVAESLRWIPLFILLTIQKLNPLFIVWSFSQINSNFFYLIVLSSLVVGSLMGLVQTRTRALVTFSSISHVGWFLTGIAFSLETGLLYFFIYRVILLAPILLLEHTNMSHINQLPLIQIKLQNQCILFFSLLSLGGLPPFLGFLPKWAILQLSMTFSFYFLALVIIITSLFTLYFYLRLMFSAFIFGGVKITQEKCAPASFFSNFLLSLSLGGLSLIYFL